MALYLYPRLLAHTARRLHDEYSSLSIAELGGIAAQSHPAAVYVATGADRVPANYLHQIRAAVLVAAIDAGFPGSSDDSRRAAFDLWLAQHLHANAGLFPAEASAGDVWAFMALVLMPDVAYWRYPRPPGDRILRTDLTRHVFGRLWWRAHLVHDSRDTAGDPYSALGILGEGAFDQIYSRRRMLGASPHVVRGILRVWDVLEKNNLNERLLLQDFLMRLLRLAPFVVFESLDDDSLDAELRIAAVESVRQLSR